jgi:hypothetical protein
VRERERERERERVLSVWWGMAEKDNDLFVCQRERGKE